MKLYRVEYHGEIMVAANSKEEALDVADNALRNETSAVIEDIYADSAHEAMDPNYIAPGWCTDTIPFGSDKPIKEYL